MKLRVGAASDIGRSRERNEDSFLTAPPLYVVADGMGGARGGAVASSLAVEVLSNMDDADGDRLAERIRDANRAVFERQAENRSLTGMGTTLTALVADGETVRLGHVGDSRAYLLRDGELKQLTEDHTLVNQMVREGKISEEEAHTHPQRSIITRALGVDRDVDVDETTVEVRAGDRLLLCTDGLTSMMREESIREILETHPDPQEAADALVDAANRAGGLDNVTVVVMDFVEGDGVEVLAPESSGGSAAGAGPPRSAPEPHPSNSARHPGPTEASAGPDVTGVISPVRADREPLHRGAPRCRRPLLWVGAVVVVLVVGVVALKVYANGQWYVGVEEGNVAIYQGLPTTIAGIHLSHPVRQTGIPAKAAERLALYRELANGILVDDEPAANRLVRKICSDLTAQMNQHKHGRTARPRGCP
jgi:protein phosphatase